MSGQRDTGAGPSTSDAVPPSRWGLTSVCVGFALVILDATVLNVAAPTLQAQLRADDAELLWAVDAYVLAFAALLLSTGLLGDRWGARTGFRLGPAVFTVASVGCAAAPTVGVLIGARVVQGAGAALLAPTSLALIHALYPEGGRRVSALATWASVSGVAFAAGPLVGGALVETVGWRSVFWVDVPVGLAALALTVRHVAPTPPRPVRSHAVGQLLAAVALTAVTAALIEAGHRGWSDRRVLAALALGVVVSAVFVVHERRQAEPLVPTASFTSPPLRAGLLAGAAFNFTMYGSLFVYTLHLQEQRGYPPLLTGLAFLPLTLVHSPVASLLAKPWTAARGPRRPLAAGLGCTVVGTIGFAVAASEPYWVLAVALAVFGVGSGLITTSMTSLVLANVPGDSVGVSCGLLNAARQLGGVLGIALLGSLVIGRLPEGVVLAETLAVAAVASALVVLLRWSGPPVPARSASA